MPILLHLVPSRLSVLPALSVPQRFWIEKDETGDLLLTASSSGAPALLRRLPLKWTDFPPASQKLLHQFLESNAEETPWQVEVDGHEYEAIVLSWNLIATDSRRRDQPIQILGFRPTFFIPSHGTLDVFSLLRNKQVQTKRFILQDPTHYMFSRLPVSPGEEPNSPLPTQALDSQFSGVPSTSGAIVTIPNVVWLRKGNQSQLEPLSGSLAISETDTHERFRFFYWRNGLLNLLHMDSSEELESAVRLHTAYQDFTPIRLPGQSNRAASLRLLALILDERSDNPESYFLFRKNLNSPLQLIRAQEIQIDPAKRPPPAKLSLISEVPQATLAAPPREAVPNLLLNDFLEWRDRTEPPPKDVASEGFNWFLSETPMLHPHMGPPLGYSEAIEVMRHLENPYNLYFRQPSISEFLRFKKLNLLRTENPNDYVFLLDPILTKNLRFRSKPTPQRVYLLNRPATSAHPVFEIIAQSATGRAFLRQLLPAIRNGELNVVETHGIQPPVQVEASFPHSYIKVSLDVPLGALVIPLLRSGALVLRHGMVRSTSHASLLAERPAADELSALAEVHRFIHHVLVELVRDNPQFLPYAEGLKIPSDGELIREWGMPFDRVAHELTNRPLSYCRFALEAMGANAETEKAALAP